VAVFRSKTHGFKCRCEDWVPPPRSFADDAHNCIMVRSTHGSTEYNVVAGDFCARWQAPLGSSVGPLFRLQDLLLLVKGEVATIAIHSASNSAE
jgi:hypothetical protein